MPTNDQITITVAAFAFCVWLALLARRFWLRANRTAQVEMLAAEGDGDYYYQATAGAGVKVGALAKGRK
jgi:hypothetical protein